MWFWNHWRLNELRDLGIFWIWKKWRGKIQSCELPFSWLEWWEKEIRCKKTKTSRNPIVVFYSKWNQCAQMQLMELFHLQCAWVCNVWSIRVLKGQTWPNVWWFQLVLKFSYILFPTNILTKRYTLHKVKNWTPFPFPRLTLMTRDMAHLVELRAKIELVAIPFAVANLRGIGVLASKPPGPLCASARNLWRHQKSSVEWYFPRV